MACLLHADCLNEIFEYLEDKVDLYSCLLVNRLWCEVSVRILWTNIQNYNTLIACLPNESKEILCKNDIIISTPTSKPLLFNYVAFIKHLSVTDIGEFIEKLSNPITSQSLDYNKYILAQEMFRMFMNQISSLKELEFSLILQFSIPPPFSILPPFSIPTSFLIPRLSIPTPNYSYIPNINFINYPGAIDCLKNLSRLNCGSDIYSEFFYQLSQVCHNIQSLKITFRRDISDGLADLISVQQNLKYLSIYNS